MKFQRSRTAKGLYRAYMREQDIDDIELDVRIIRARLRMGTGLSRLILKGS